MSTDSFVGHLSELRKRIIWILVVIGLALVIGLVAGQPIIRYLQQHGPAAEYGLTVFSPWDAVRLYMNVAFGIAIVIALPFTLYQLWAFVSPGLKEAERRGALLYLPIAVLLSLAGVAFAYFVVFPMAFLFSTAISDSLGLEETFGITQYFTFMFNFIIPMAILFELPVVVMFLTKIRVLNPVRLGKFRKFAFFFLFVLSAIITPPDLLSAVLVSLPMMLLYELSVMLSRRVYRKQLAMDAAAQEAS